MADSNLIIPQHNKIDPFVHLHSHVDKGSVLDGYSSVAEAVGEAARLGQPAFAVTDHGSLASLYELYQEGKNQGVKGIAGCEFYAVPSIGTIDSRGPLYLGDGTRNDVSGRGAYTHLTVLAENNTGLVNLFKLSQVASVRGFYLKPRISLEVLEEFKEGLIVTTGCPSGEIQTELRLGHYDKAVAYASKLVDIFGRENVFVELMDHGMKQELERSVRAELMQIAADLKLELVATNDLHFARHENAKSHEEMLAIQTKALMSEPADYDGGKRFAFEGDGSYYVKSAAEMLKVFPAEDYPRAISNTLLIAERSGFEVNFNPNLRPSIPLPEGETEDSWLRKESYEGLRRRLPEKANDPIYIERLEKELGVLSSKGFSGYFLVVSDFIRWAKFKAEPKIPMGPGRGSAAGSLIAYATDITDADPIRFDLLFERFLNPERDSPPDVDIDVSDYDRGRLIEYVRQRYGDDQVSLVITFGTIGAKQAMKDIARIYERGFDVGEQLSKALPPPIFGKEIKLKEVYDPEAKRYPEAQEFRDLVEANGYQDIVDSAKKLEGRVRSHGTHAAAVIISNSPLVEHIPVIYNQKMEMPQAQWDYPTAESMGFIKMDFLGLRNLGIIQEAVEHVQKTRNIHLDIPALQQGALDDKATYDLLQKGDSLGVFQLDSPGIRSLLKILKPTEFDDISVVLSLYRPGPMGVGAHTSYAYRKNGLEPVSALHPEFEETLHEVLSPTQGIIVYQEQVQRIAQIVAGYSLAQADLLRRAMGKKKRSIIDAEFVPFQSGARAKGYSDEAIKTLWDVLVPFADYAFNKCFSDRTMIRMADGTIKSGREIYNLHKSGEALDVMSMWPDGEIRPHKIKNVVATGIKPAYKITTQSGRTITTSIDHRLLTTRGYQKVEDMVVGSDELIVADRLPISDLQKVSSIKNIQKAHALPISEIQKNARSKNMVRLNSRPERVDQDKRSSERMKAYQATLSFEDRSAHQKAINLSTERGKVAAAAMRKAYQERYDNDEEFRSKVIDHLASVRYIAEEQGYGRKSYASNGMYCESNNELAMAEYLIANNIGFEMHKNVGRGQCDFYFEGIYWEMDGMDRHVSYFERKYGDLPFIVVTPEDFKEKISEVLSLDHARNGDLIISISPVSRRTPMIDIEMEENGPKNFVTFKGVVSHNSHTVAYGLTSYLTAFLKANYTSEYMAALLTSVSNNTDKTAEYLEDCRQHNIKVTTPNLNKSLVGYAPVSSKEISFGFGAIKGVGEKVSEELVKYREEHGDFTSFNHFLNTAPKSFVNKKVIQALALGGGFDGLPAKDGINPATNTLYAPLSRRAIFDGIEAVLGVMSKARARVNTLTKRLTANEERLVNEAPLLAELQQLEEKSPLDKDQKKQLNTYLRFVAKCEKDKVTVQEELDQLNSDSAGSVDYAVEVVEEWSKLDKLKLERTSLGLYVSGHPLDDLDIDGLSTAKVVDLVYYETTGEVDGEEVVVRTPPTIKPLENWPGPKDKPHKIAGILTNLSIRRTKKGDSMASGILEDKTGAIPVIVFPKAYKVLGEHLKLDGTYQFTGFTKERDGDISFNVEALRPLEFSTSGKLSLRIKLTSGQWERGADELYRVFKRHPGSAGSKTNVVVSIKTPEGVISEEVLEVSVNTSPALTQEIRERFGMLAIGRWRTPKV